MKRILKPTISVLLILALLSGFVLAASDPILKSTLPLADNADLISGTWQIRNADGETANLQEHYVTYTPSAEVVPMVVYGSTLYGRSAMNVTVKYLADQNLSMVAGINGSFFDLQTGIPLGLVVTDGILRSSEIELMNLNGCRLVVLSACETGLGYDDSSEGVYGLQRAFKLSGAEKIMMSLWEVPDMETSLLMSSFYKNLKAGDNPNEALVKAQMAAREQYPSPESWGGFVILN